MTTLNKSYDALRARWDRETGTVHLPECENCSKDLTGQNVTDTGSMWVCDGCAHETDDDYMTSAQEARHERQQMGFCD